MIKSYVFIKKNRFTKKLNLYKRAFLLMFDLTLFTYIFLLAGYFAFAFFRSGSRFSTLDLPLDLIELILLEQLPFIVTIIPLIYIVKANKQAGILFSSTEGLFLNLPYRKEGLFFLLAAERWLSFSIKSLVAGSIIYLVTAIEASLIFKYVFLFIIINLLMTLPQWILFQRHFLVRLFFLFVGVMINLINALVNSPYISLVYLFLLLCIQPVLYRQLFSKLDIERTMASGDFLIWNMLVLSHVTKVQFKRDKQTSILQKLPYWRRPFKEEKAIHNRLWYVYFENNIKSIGQLIGVLLLLQIVILFMKENYFPVVIALVIYVYSAFLTVLFEDHFTSKLILQLPWDLQAYKRSFLRWGSYSFLVLFVPIIVYLINQPLKWILPLIILYSGSFLFLCHTKLNKSIARLKKDDLYVDDSLFVGVLFLLIICLSTMWPLLSLSSLYFIYLILKKHILVS